MWGAGCKVWGVGCGVWGVRCRNPPTILVRMAPHEAEPTPLLKVDCRRASCFCMEFGHVPARKAGGDVKEQ